MIRNNNIDRRAVRNGKLGGNVSCKRGYIYEDFKYNVITAKYLGGAATGTAGDRNIMQTRMNTFEYRVQGTQTILAPVLTTVGLDISLDQTDNDGVEYTHGILSRCEVAFTIGTSAAFSFRVKFKIADVSGTDDCCVGFRKAEAYQTAVDDYDEAAFLNVILGDIKIETILNAAATTTTDTTDNWADAATHTLKVSITAGGVVTYLIDGVAPTTTAAFTFDSAEVVIPFFLFIQATTTPGIVELIEWEVGTADEDNEITASLTA